MCVNELFFVETELTKIEQCHEHVITDPKRVSKVDHCVSVSSAAFVFIERSVQRRRCVFARTVYATIRQFCFHPPMEHLPTHSRKIRVSPRLSCTNSTSQSLCDFVFVHFSVHHALDVRASYKVKNHPHRLHLVISRHRDEVPLSKIQSSSPILVSKCPFPIRPCLVTTKAWLQTWLYRAPSIQQPPSRVP